MLQLGQVVPPVSLSSSCRIAAKSVKIMSTVINAAVYWLDVVDIFVV
jgi:hypothetical protein